MTADVKVSTDELRPWMRMTHPRMIGPIDITSVPIGERWFRSIVRALFRHRHRRLSAWARSSASR